MAVLDQTINHLKNEYNQVLANEEASVGRIDTFQALIRQEGRQKFEDQHDGQTFANYAQSALVATKALTFKEAKAAASAIEDHLVESESMRRELKAFKGTNKIDPKLLKSQLNRHEGALNSRVIEAYTKAHFDDSKERHEYKLTYAEHEEMGKPSKLKNEPSEIAASLKFIQGYPMNAKLGQVVKDRGAQDQQVPNEALLYLAKLSQRVDKKLPDLTTGYIEKEALRDAKAASLFVEVKKVNQNDLALQAEERQEKEQKQAKKHADHQAAVDAYTKSLVAGAYTIALANDDSKLTDVKAHENAKTKQFVQEMQKENPKKQTVGDLRKYLYAKGDAQDKVVGNQLRLLTSVERKNQQAIKERLKETPKKKATGKSQEGGRQIGESRPGGNAFKNGH